ncbi:MAG TPA: hypothetical protein VJ747_08510 [Stellaceae bacterium]|nr:hypothetical protein [Stellaceae bacterium]
MSGGRSGTKLRLAALAAFVLGGVGCIVGAVIDQGAFFPAWLCAVIFWLGLPLGAVTLVLVHDLTGGNWMTTARPTLNAAIATMPIATIAFVPIFAGLGHLYVWSRPEQPGLGNTFYLNDTFFIVRYAVYVVIWNALALWALIPPRVGALGVAPALSWLSAIGLLLLAFAVSFAAIDWILSLEPHFWSSIFGMIFGAAEFNTALALLLVVIALRGPTAHALGPAYRDHVADLAAILLATTIFWAYAEFCQFLIIWEENLRSEIPWYLRRMAGAWESVMYTVAGAGFFVPFFVLIWTPSKRNRAIVAAICALIFLAHLIHVWWLVLPEFPKSGFGWIDVSAVLALGGLWALVFLARLQFGRLLPERWARPATEAPHG